MLVGIGNEMRSSGDGLAARMTPIQKYVVKVLIAALTAIIVLWNVFKLSSDTAENGAPTVVVDKSSNVISKVSIDPDTWKPPILPEDLRAADQSDPRLAEHIRDNWIIPPARGERNLKKPDQVHYSQRGQSEFVDKVLNKRTNGFFIECGAANGEALSNSLFFEKSRNWTGILIEANPEYFKQILKLKRHAYTLNACLSPNGQPGVLDFKVAGYIGGLANYMGDTHKKRVQVEHAETDVIQLQCFPLVSILRALKVTQVDFFSLDIEGAEVDILQYFPFDEIKVDVLTIEYFIPGDKKETKKKLARIQEILVGKYGYKQTSYDGLDDVIFQRGG